MNCLELNGLTLLESPRQVKIQNGWQPENTETVSHVAPMDCLVFQPTCLDIGKPAPEPEIPCVAQLGPHQ